MNRATWVAVVGALLLTAGGLPTSASAATPTTEVGASGCPDTGTPALVSAVVRECAPTPDDVPAEWAERWLQGRTFWRVSDADQFVWLAGVSWQPEKVRLFGEYGEIPLQEVYFDDDVNSSGYRDIYVVPYEDTTDTPGQYAIVLGQDEGTRTYCYVIAPWVCFDKKGDKASAVSFTWNGSEVVSPTEITQSDAFALEQNEPSTIRCKKTVKTKTGKKVKKRTFAGRWGASQTCPAGWRP